MGMFERPENWEDHFKEGDVFELESARIGKSITTKFGDATPALLKIGGKWYSLIGQGVVDQIANMEDGDLPARVIVTRVPTKSGNEVKKIVPEGVAADDIPF